LVIHRVDDFAILFEERELVVADIDPGVREQVELDYMICIALVVTSLVIKLVAIWKFRRHLDLFGFAN